MNITVIIIILLTLMDNYLEVFARTKYGPYEEE